MSGREEERGENDREWKEDEEEEDEDDDDGRPAGAPSTRSSKSSSTWSVEKSADSQSNDALPLDVKEMEQLGVSSTIEVDCTRLPSRRTISPRSIPSRLPVKATTPKRIEGRTKMNECN